MRLRPERARDLHDDVSSQMKTIRRVSRAESALAQAWSAAAPDALAERCELIGIKAGHAEIGVPDASTRYQADRWLRGGGLGELSALAKIPTASSPQTPATPWTAKAAQGSSRVEENQRLAATMER